MRAIRGKDTAPERFVRKLLYAEGYRYRLHRKDLPGTPDIVFPGRRAVVFVHGCFWHGHDCSGTKLPGSSRDYWHPKIQANKERDLRCTSELSNRGWRVLVVWACELRDCERVAKTLREFLGPVRLELSE